MKICIVLDEEMKEWWEIAKESLEANFKMNIKCAFPSLIPKCSKGYLRHGNLEKQP
jgi:hypothetical protein